MEITKDISYLGKDFGQFRKNLIDFTKQYFPNDYTDFNESSPGMLFMEMASYVGDVLSYYTDNNLKESLLEQASERKNIYDLAKTLGYKAKNVIPAVTVLDVFQLDNLQLGTLYSTYGVVALISYLYGGTLADRFQPRILMGAALVMTSIGGFLMP